MKRQLFHRWAGEIGGPRPHGARRGRRRGVSLVLVLAFLVIITGLVLAFFASVTNALSSAQSNKGEIVARQLAESAVQIVMGTISQATMTAGAATPTTWSSQPGMIWNFDTSGNATTAYKLYSSDNAIVSPAQGFDSSTDVPAATVWSARPALYTDLNAPVTKTIPGTSTSSLVFPILDGNNMEQTTVDGQATPVLTYTPSTSNPNLGVAGFSLDPTSTSLTNTSGLNPSSTNNPVPMPVKWVYVLKDGTMTTPTGVDGTGNVASWTGPGVKAPTADNPIVGRVAFWTDDETCKVNINTASQGTAWDTPRGESSTEISYAAYQPAQHEWQRYPGHPAMVSLSTIFPGLSASSIYAITPRVAAGGSLGGTQAPTGPITPDADRLYASLDELMFTPTRTATSNITQSLMEQKKFFLTARSVAPEVNLFDLPRVACWPVASLNGSSYDLTRTTAFDRLIGTCSTIGNMSGKFYPYYFQRQNYLSPTNDIGITRNKQLYSYLQNLTSAVAPGYTASFANKYGNACRDQILTEIFDYIRSTNLADDNLAAQTNPTGVTYTPYVSGSTTSVAGHGFVAPTVYTTPQGTVTQGFGRAYTLAEFGLGFICNADGNDPAPTSPTDATTSNNPATNSVLGGTALQPNTKYIQAIVILSFFSPSNGWTSLQPDMQVQITGLDQMTVTDSSGKSHQLFQSENGVTAPTVNNTTLYGWAPNGGGYGSNPGWRYTLNWKTAPARGNYAADAGYTAYNYSKAPAFNNIPPYPFIGIPVILNVKSSTSDTMTFSGNSNIQVSFYAGTFANGSTITPSTSNLIQTININMPAATFPVPNLVRTPTSTAPYTTTAVLTGTSTPTPLPTTMQNWWSYTRSPAVTFTSPSTWGNSNGRLYFAQEGPYNGNGVGAGAFFINSSTSPPSFTPTTVLNNTDVVRTVCPADSDFRLVAGLHNVPSTVFVPHANYNNTSMYIASGLTTAGLPFKEQVNNDAPFNTPAYAFFPVSTGVSVNYFYPDAPSTMTSALGTYTPLTPYSQKTWDYDISIPQCFDGPYINKPDEGNMDFTSGIPYYGNWSVQNPGGATYFTPNRIMTSPGMFGSLPTGIVPPVGTGSVGTLTPWQTLLFRPQPIHPQSSTVPPFDVVNGVSPSRPGTAPDHLLLDLFWMPVVEPYALSDSFSTAGKINMNYQISPFKYITRNTALRALFQNEKVASILNTDYINFKNKSQDTTVPVPSPTKPEIRRSIDSYQTLTQFNQFFKTNGLFRSASQICDLYIVPADPAVNSLTPSTMAAYWLNHIATGDNLRERVYTNLYPRLTTKSNTYTVHFRAQALKQSPNSLANGIWNEAQDPVLAEYRGSSVIERYIDPSDPALTATDFASESIPATTSLSQFYRWRVIETHRFAP